MLSRSSGVANNPSGLAAMNSGVSGLLRRQERGTGNLFKKHRMNLQVIASTDGDILWVPGALPGSVHDKRPSGFGVLDELEKAGLVILAH